MTRQIVSEVFTPGSVVYLLSGGPAMTVVGITGGGVAECVWFDTTGHVQKAYFPAFLLTNSKPTADDVGG